MMTGTVSEKKDKEAYDSLNYELDAYTRLRI